MATSAASERVFSTLGMSWIAEVQFLKFVSSENNILFFNSAFKAKKEAFKV